MSHIKRSLTEAAQKPVATFYGFKGAPSARKAGSPKGTGLHSLRHYFATLPIRSDASVKRVQLALGHSTPTITLNTYVGEWPDTDRQTRSIVDAALGSVPRMCPDTRSRERVRS
jgi:integrase